MKIHYLSVLTVVVFLFGNKHLHADNYYWIKPSGDYNDINNWMDENGNSVSTPPDSTDNVFFDQLTADVYFPGGQTYYAKNIEAENTTFHFQGTNTSILYFEIHGDILFQPSVSTVYTNTNVNRWIITGNNGVYKMYFENAIVDQLTIDVPDQEFSLNTDLTVLTSLSFHRGILGAINKVINTGSFFLGTAGYSNQNSFDKIFYIDNSIINCTTQFFCKYSDPGTIEINGNYLITSPRFMLDEVAEFDHLKVKNYDAPYNRDSLSMDVKDVSINHLEIDNDFDTRIGGSMTINNLLEINKPGKTIEFSTFEDYADHNEMTINGSVSLPNVGPCNDLTTFKMKGGDVNYYIKRNSGTITFDGALMNNIRTTGNATFNVTNGYVIGSNGYWNVSNSVNSTTYFWVNGSGNWFDSGHWSLTSEVHNNPNNCIPKAFDDVIIDKFSFTGPNQVLEMDYSIGTSCRNFTWLDNPFQGVVELYRPFGYTRSTKIHITTGDFKISEDCLFDPNPNAQAYRMVFEGNGTHTINNSMPGVYLDFNGEDSNHTLASALNLDEGLTINGGTLNTNGKNITARSIVAGNGMKTLNLSNSHITADSLIRFGQSILSPVVVNGENAYIDCKDFQSYPQPYKQIKLNNDLNKNFNYDVRAEVFILNGNGSATFMDSLVTDELYISKNGAIKVNTNLGAGLRVNNSINGPTTPSNLGKIMSTSSTIQMTLEAPQNLCISGHLELENIEALDFNYHAPDGIDLGGNTGIDFSSNAFTGNIYWNGYQGDFHIPANWSNIPGGCPTTLSTIKDADSLIINDFGFNENDTIFIPVLVNINHIKFHSTNKKLAIRQAADFTATSFTSDHINLRWLGDDEGTNTQQDFEILQNVSIQDRSVFYFENLNMMLGKSAGSSSKPVLGLINQTQDPLIPLILCLGNSTLDFRGTSSNPNNHTIDFGPLTGGNITQADFVIDNRLNYTMRFNFRNYKVKSFNILKYGFSGTKYEFISDLRVGNMKIDEGLVTIYPGVTIKQEN